MGSDHGESLEALQRDTVLLRARVACLERQLSRFSTPGATPPEVASTLAEREALLAEAELVANMGSWVWDVCSDRVIWSDNLFRILGYDPDVNPASSEAFFARVHPQDVDRVRETSERIIATGISERVDYRIILPDGALRHLSMNGAVLFDEEGTLRRAVGTATDVTHQVELEDRLRQAEKMEAIGKLAGGIAHDFNNLLTIILANIDLLKMKVQATRALEDIEVAAQSAADLTSRLMSFGRKSPIEPRVVNLAGILKEFGSVVVRSLGPSVESHFDVEEGDQWVEVDPSQVQQAFLNLALNSRDAMPKGGILSIRVARGHLEAESVAGLAAGAYAVVEVRDTGEGMDPATLERVFEPFFSTKAAGRGTGLGLATVYATMRRLGGSVTVESAPGVGTTFRLYFPLVERTPERRSAQARGRDATLLVEDDEAVRKVVSQILTSCGQRVFPARDADEALGIWEKHHRCIRLLVSDVSMTGMQGPELAAKLSTAKPSLRVLLLTGYGTLERHALPTGTRLLRKPFKVSDIVEAVADLTVPGQAD